MSFADVGQGFFQSVEVVGDGAVEADLAGAPGGGDGDGDGVFVDIEADIEFNRFHGVVVSSHSVNESERLPRPERGRSCGSAPPGNPRYNERQPRQFYQARNPLPVAIQP